MKKTTQVTLLSLLVFPGTGHLLLKKYFIALAFMGSFAYLLLGIVNEIMTKSQEVVDRVIRGDLPLDLTAISQALAEQDVLGGQQAFVGYVLLFIWVFSAVDAFRIAKKAEGINAQ
ncbi:hypothetical protein [Colwellia piezophila]|uniref:hypothetical protein n=1 Tax=Colwellia piezophila TaxID=211668 RepID=UPI000374309A|nr:hypothetical protein [Colwellia piezophila]